MRRLLGAIPILLGVSVLVFALIHLPPGGPIDIYAMGGSSLSAADIARLEQQLGLDQPLPIQYLKWLGAVLRGDWGTSFVENRKVTAVILDRLPASLELSVSSFAIALVLAIPIGVLSAVRGQRVLRTTVEVGTIIGIATPTFWLGLIGIFLFAVSLRWLPAGGMYTIGAPFSLADRIEHLLLPAFVGGVHWIAAWSRYIRGSMLEVVRQDYVLTARGKGLAETVVLYRHMLRNALLPFITEVGLQIPRIVSGAVVIEIVFAWPGIGQLLMMSLQKRDYPVAMGIFIAVSAFVFLGNLLADVTYSLVDPRIRY